MNKLQEQLISNVTSGDSIGNIEASYTHVAGTKKFRVRPNFISEFWEGYCELVERRQSLTISERIIDYAPIIIEMNLRFHHSDISDHVTENFIVACVAAIEQVILTEYQLLDENHLVCFVLRPDEDLPEPGTSFITRSIRFQFPYLRVDAAMLEHIIAEITKLFREKNIFSYLLSQPQNDWKDIINHKIFHEPVMMYGSVKNTLSEKRKVLQHIYGKVDRYSIENPKEIPPIELSDVVSFNQHQDVMAGCINPHEINPDFYFWLPLFLSVKYHQTVLIPKSEGKVVSNYLNLVKPAVNDKFNLALIFINMIPDENKAQRHVWEDIGKCLYYESKGEDTGLEEWKKITKEISEEEIDREDYITVEGCHELYSCYDNTHITHKTMAWYARSYNSSEYNEWHLALMKEKRDRALSCLDSDVAQALYWTYWLDYTYTTNKTARSGTWYKFENHRWNVMDQALDISNAVSRGEFYNTFERMTAEIAHNRANLVNDQNKKDIMTTQINRIEYLTKKLRMHSYKNNVIKEAAVLFHNEDFLHLVDNNTKIMGHANCVHEIVMNHVIFRDGKPEDYVTKKTGVKYDRKMDEYGPDGKKKGYSHIMVLKFLVWMSKMFTNPETRDSFMLFWCSMLIGGNPDKLIPCLTGEGDNGKSILIRAMSMLLGEYFFKFSDETISGKRSGGPSPELAQSKNARLGIFDELEEGAILKTNFMKKVSGGDSFFARFLNDNGGMIEATFKIMLLCNTIPRMNSFHRSIKQRFIVYPCNSTWVDRHLAPVDEEEQYKKKTFPVNTQFIHEVQKMIPAILWYLKELYPRYSVESIPRPKESVEATTSYWNDVDIYDNFKRSEMVQEFVTDPKTGQKVPNVEIKLKLDRSYQAFRVWFKQNFESELVPSIREFKINMERALGQKVYDDLWWRSIRLVEKTIADMSAIKPNN